MMTTTRMMTTMMMMMVMTKTVVVMQTLATPLGQTMQAWVAGLQGLREQEVVVAAEAAARAEATAQAAGNPVRLQPKVAADPQPQHSVQQQQQ